MRNLISFWFLLILGMIALGIGLSFALQGNWPAAGAMFLLALVLVVLVIATKKDGKA
jgi:membrane protein YdbS with pleckstrin-like domain